MVSSAIVSNETDLLMLAERVRQASRVALDTEFHSERSYAARLMVIQLGFADGVVIVDPLAITNLRPLIEALTDTMVVGHALSGDLKIFADRFELLPKAIFDSQIAASFCGFGSAVSLLDLVHAITGTRLRKSQTVSDWSTRPLTPRQVEYLVDDVAHLFTLHDGLSARLKALGRMEWALEEMAPFTKLAHFRPDPERLYLRLQGAARMGRRDLGVLRELALLRDRLARERDVPPKYIFSDDTVTGLVALQPVDSDDLTQLRRLEPAARKAYGPEILAAVQRALALPEEALPQRPSRPPSNQREAVVALLSVYVNTLAVGFDIPPGLLAPRAALERLARRMPLTVAAFAEVSELSPWRVDLLAEPLLNLLSGRTALAIEGAAQDLPRVVQVAVPLHVSE